MTATIKEQAIHALEILKEEEIAAPIELVFETILEQIGPENEAPKTGRMPMKLEPWPGGRWWRDLGNGAGHYWGNVQAIKPPSLLEICGPMFMSHPAISTVQFRLEEMNGITLLKFSHRAMAQIADPQMLEGWGHIETGWDNLVSRIRSLTKK